MLLNPQVSFSGLLEGLRKKYARHLKFLTNFSQLWVNWDKYSLCDGRPMFFKLQPNSIFSISMFVGSRGYLRGLTVLLDDERESLQKTDFRQSALVGTESYIYFPDKFVSYHNDTLQWITLGDYRYLRSTSCGGRPTLQVGHTMVVINKFSSHCRDFSSNVLDHWFHEILMFSNLQKQ